jgi:hypothetical protein
MVVGERRLREGETDVLIRNRCLVVTETERVTRSDLFLRR